MKDWYRKWWVWAIIVFALFVIVLPFMIDNHYRTKSDYVHMWGAADMLAYYGSLLSFIGTVVLCVIAVWQNRKANEINDKLLELTRKEKFGYFYPENKIEVSNGYVRHVDYIHNILNPGISLIGHGSDNLFVSKIGYTVNGMLMEETETSLFVACEGSYSKIYFPIRLTDNEKDLLSIDIEMTIFLQNSKSYKYIQFLYLSLQKVTRGGYKISAFNTRFMDDINENNTDLNKFLTKEDTTNE